MKIVRNVLALIICLVCMSSVSYAASWQWVHSTDKIGFYFDASSVRKDSYGYIYYWEKQQFEDYNDRTRMAEEMQAISDKYSLGQDWSDFYSLVSYYKIKIEHGQYYYMSLSSVAYDINGRTIYSENNDSQNWNIVPPGAIKEEIINQAIRCAR